jgi:hypothetical protein
MKICVVLTQVALTLTFCGCFAATQTPQPGLSLPAGTAIPISFPHTINAAKLKVGDAVITKTDQMVLGSGGERIPRGSKLVGSVVEVQPSRSSTDPSELAIRFETLRVRDQVFPIHVALRALASFVDSYSTRSPAIDHGYPDDSVYRQVGGDYFYLQDVVYSNDWDVVGKSTDEGVFVKLERIDFSKSRNHVVCDSTDTVQSVGVFASSACGVYDFPDLTVDASGADNSRAIRFRSTKHAVKIASGSSALLQVIGTTE